MSTGTWASHWAEYGYVVVPGLFDRVRTKKLQCVCENVLAQWRRANPETGEPGGDGTATVMRHLNHAGYFLRDRGGFADLMDAVADVDVLRVGRAILGEAPLFRCTSLFMNPLHDGQDGNWHRDSQFHHPDEAAERAAILDGGDAGHSIQMQVALLPSDDVEVVPGSHQRWDSPAEYAIRRGDDGANSRMLRMPGALRVALEPGDAVAFNPFGLHRGRYHVDRRRLTLMLTYTRTSRPRFDIFSNQPWFDEPDYLDGLEPRVRAFFEAFVEAYGEQWRASD